MLPEDSSVSELDSFPPAAANSRAPRGRFQTNAFGSRTSGRRRTSATTALSCQNAALLAGTQWPTRTWIAGTGTSRSQRPHQTRTSGRNASGVPSGWLHVRRSRTRRSAADAVAAGRHAAALRISTAMTGRRTR